MRSHLRSVAKQKVSDFLTREEGMVGNRSAFATAALVSTTALAMTLLVAPDAEAEKWCPNARGYCWDDEDCCWNGAMGARARYWCADEGDCP